MAAAALAGGAVMTIRVLRELAWVRRREADLRHDWQRIPSVAGGPPLGVHSLVSEHGDKSLPPIVLVLGFGISSSYFVPLAERLSSAAWVYVPDLPGHGRSDHDVRPLRIREHAHALVAWMDAMRLRHALLAGHSMGCQVVAGRRRPGRISLPAWC